MCHVSPPIYPQETYKAVYERKYTLYKHVIECLDPLWGEMQNLIEWE